ncbi:sulfate transporter family-domain-containing protein, partial [Tribonema minus]
RADSWGDHPPGSGNATLTTEADLHQQFAGPRFISSRMTVKEAIANDWATVKTYFKKQVRRIYKRASEVHSARDVAAMAAQPFPIVKTVANYKKSYVSHDAGAGLVEGIMKVPSGLAYALLANMPAQYGLYTSLMPPFIYMLMGTCSQISFGVTAIEALFLGESVRGVLGDDIIESEDDADVNIVVRYTLYISFMVGIWQLIFRFLQLNFISVLLADPVMSGFSTGGAFIIATSQLGGLLGIKLGNSEFLPELWAKAISMFDDWNWCAIGMGLTGLVLLVICQTLNRKFFPRYPVPWQIFLVILSIVVTKEMDLKEDYKLSVIGDIPSGFPTAEFPSLPDVPGHTHGQLFAKSIVPSFLIALFVYVMTLSLGTFFAGKNGYKVDASQELLAVGTANAVSSMCGAFICSASFSRTAVVNTLGAKTVLHNVMALVLMILAVTLITEQLYYLPKCILAVIVINALGAMLEFDHGAKYYTTSKADFAVWMLTFIVCLLGGAMYGIYAGIGLALLIVLWRSASAKIVVLGRLPGTAVYRNIERFPMAKETQGVKTVRFDGSLNFANWEKAVDTLDRLATKDVHTIALDASAITTIDSSSLRGLLKLIKDFEAKGVKLLLANWKGPQRDLLERSGFYEHVTDDTLFLTLHDAVLFAKGR